MSRRIAFICICALILLNVNLYSADWPQYGGPERNGVITKEKLPDTWPEGGPPLIWSADVGVGGGSCAIVGDKVYVLGALPDPITEERKPPSRDTLICLNRETGAILWTQPLGDLMKKHTYHSPHATPTVADGKVYSTSRTGRLTCHDAQSGQLIWQVETAALMGDADHSFYGYSVSPLVDEGRVIVWSRYGDGGLSAELMEKLFTEEDRKELEALDPDKRQRMFWRPRCSVLAFDAGSGKLLWRTRPLKGSTRNDLASPNMGTFHGEKQLIWPTGTQLAAVRPEDGKILWTFDYSEQLKVDKLGPSHSDVMPIIYGDIIIDKLWNHKETNCTFAVKVTEKGPQLLWKTNTMVSWYHPPIAWDGLLLGLDNQGLIKGSGGALPGTRPKDLGMLQCYDIETGELLWHTNDFDPTLPEQLLQRERHSYILVDGKLIIQSPSGGIIFVTVDRAGSSIFGVIESNQKGRGYPQPAFADGQLFIRRMNGTLNSYNLVHGNLH